jgi:hypothetical protein
VGVARNLFIDFKRQRQRSSTGGSSDAGLRSIADGCKKGFELETQRFSARRVKFLER